MGKVVVKIPHCVWRDGRPRFSPGPKLRSMGFEGRDLCDVPAREARSRGVDPGWWSLDRVEAWIRTELEPAIRARETAPKGRRRSAAKPKAGAVTVAELVAWSVKAADLKPATRKFYKAMETALTAEASELWVSAARDVRPAHVFNAIEAIAKARGIATANGCRALLTRSWAAAVLREWSGLTTNPASSIPVTTPAGRLRAGTPAEIRALVAAADAIGRPEIGDCIVLGAMTGQRQADRLALEHSARRDGWILFKQRKTGAVVEVPETPWLTERLAAATRRRADWAVRPLLVVVNETTKRAWGGTTYAQVFAQVRAAAVAGIRAPDGREIVKATPSLKDFRDQDLRDTAVTWAIDGGATAEQIASLTGHSRASVTRMIDRHYGARTREQAQVVSDKIVGRLEG